MIEVGSRVLIKTPSRYIASIRKLGEEGRLGTVDSVFTPAGSNRILVRVAFDTKRKGAKPVVEFFTPDELTLHYGEAGNG